MRDGISGECLAWEGFLDDNDVDLGEVVDTERLHRKKTWLTKLLVQMCTLLYTTFTHFAVSQSILQNRFTVVGPSEITLMNRVDQSQASKCGTDRQTYTQSYCRSPSALRAVGLENKLKA